MLSSLKFKIFNTWKFSIYENFQLREVDLVSKYWANWILWVSISTLKKTIGNDVTVVLNVLPCNENENIKLFTLNIFLSFHILIFSLEFFTEIDTSAKDNFFLFTGFQEIFSFWPTFFFSLSSSLLAFSALLFVCGRMLQKLQKNWTKN